jgi:Ca2+-binding EF-hand superfamily protein
MSKGPNISKEDQQRFAELFNTIDRNKDGRIDISDLSALLKSKNVPNASDQAQVWIM